MTLHIRNVSKTYPSGVQALKDVTLTIPAGMYGLLGPNGAGKSTLMRIVAMHAALRRLLEKDGSGAPPLPTSLDLYRELQAVTPDQFQSLLHDLFEVNAYWELETERATAEQTAAGTWQVTLDVRVRKVVVDEAGVETEVPMDDWVEVGVFVEGDQPGTPFYAQKHRIRSGKQTITVTMRRKPTRAGIDPHHLLIDLDTDDNTAKVKVQN